MIVLNISGVLGELTAMPFFADPTFPQFSDGSRMFQEPTFPQVSGFVAQSGDRRFVLDATTHVFHVEALT